MAPKKQKKVLKEFFHHYPEYLNDCYALHIIHKKIKCAKKAAKEGKPYDEYLVDIHNMAELLYKELKGL